MLDAVPEAGDVEAVEGLVAGFVVRAQRFAARAVGVRAAGDGLVAASVGGWASVLGQRSVRLAAGLDDAAGGCRQVAGVLAGYAAALRGLQRRVGIARHEVGSARIRAVAARERYAAAVLAAGGGAGVPWSWTDVPGFAAVPEAAGELRVWRAAVDDVAVGLGVFAACCDERQVLDRQTAARLVGVEVMAAYAPGTGVDAVVDVPLVQGLAAAGAGTVTAAQRQVLAVWFADAAAAVAHDPQDEVPARVLAGFLDAWGADTGVMGGVFATLGGDRTVQLVTALGNAVRFGDHAHNDTLAGLGRRLRAGLASGSTDWSGQQAEQFAETMFGPVLFADGTASAIGYLFADPGTAPMGAAFTVAVADRIDAWEQEHGRLPTGVHQPGYWLAAAAAPGTDPRDVLDAASGVFATLGNYPDTARDWLCGSFTKVSDLTELESARIEYWFGLRDWSTATSDGFAGVSALWAGVQIGGSERGVAMQIAAVNERIFAHLYKNPTLTPGAVSVDASVSFAQVVGRQLEGLIELGILSDPAQGAGAWELVTAPHRPIEFPAAMVAKAELLVVLGAAVDHEQGRSNLQQWVVEYQAAALAATRDLGASPDGVLRRLASVWGTLDGATATAQEAAARLETETRLSAFTAAAEVPKVALGLLPMPGYVAVIIEQGLAGAQERVEDGIRASVAEEMSPVIERSDFLEDSFASLVGSFQRDGAWDRPPLHVEGGPDDPRYIARSLATDYIDAALSVRGIDLEARKP